MAYEAATTANNEPQERPTCMIKDTSAVRKEIENLSEDIRKKASLLQRQMRAAGINNPTDLTYTDDFYRFRKIDPYHIVEGGYEYLFFTKPDLNIMNSGGVLVPYSYGDTDIYGQNSIHVGGGTENVPYFQFLKKANYDKTVLRDLCMSGGNDHCPFVRMLSNRKVSNMDVPDIVTNEIETSQNMYGTRIFYPTSSMKSDEDIEFNIEFEDTQFLEIYHFFKAYDMYRQLKWMGIVQPKEEYRVNKILHDHMSIFKFIVDVDGETILYWAKATGVYPKTISRSSFSEIQDKGGLRITVGFKLSGWFEDMDPAIIADFNELAGLYGDSTEYPIWDDKISAVSGETVDYFYISQAQPTTDWVNHKNYHRFLLKAGKRNR